MQAVIRVDRRDFWNGLREGNVNGGLVVKVKVKVVGNFFHRAFFGAFAAARALCFVNVAGLALDVNRKVSDVAGDACDFAVRQNADVGVLADFGHSRSYDTRGAVQCRERFVQHGHLSADRRLFFHQVNREAGLGNVERGCNAGNSAADYKSALCHRSFARSKGRVQYRFRDGGFSQSDGLFGRVRHVLHYPRALLANVGHLDLVTSTL